MPVSRTGGIWAKPLEGCCKVTMDWFLVSRRPNAARSIIQRYSECLLIIGNKLPGRWSSKNTVAVCWGQLHCDWVVQKIEIHIVTIHTYALSLSLRKFTQNKTHRLMRLRYSNSDKARSSGHRLLRLHDIISSVWALVTIGGCSNLPRLWEKNSNSCAFMSDFMSFHVQLSSSQVSWVSSKGLNRNGFKKMCSNESQVEHVSQVGYVLHVSPVNYVTLPVCV